jgi:hypothetical protein
LLADYPDLLAELAEFFPESVRSAWEPPPLPPPAPED